MVIPIPLLSILMLSSLEASPQKLILEIALLEYLQHFFGMFMQIIYRIDLKEMAWCPEKSHHTVISSLQVRLINVSPSLNCGDRSVNLSSGKPSATPPRNGETTSIELNSSAAGLSTTNVSEEDVHSRLFPSPLKNSIISIKSCQICRKIAMKSFKTDITDFFTQTGVEGFPNEVQWVLVLPSSSKNISNATFSGSFLYS